MKLETYFKMQEDIEKLAKTRYWFDYIADLMKGLPNVYLTKEILEQQIQRAEEIEELLDAIKHKKLLLMTHNSAVGILMADKLWTHDKVIVKVYSGGDVYFLYMTWDEKDNYFVYKNIENKPYPHHQAIDNINDYIQIIEKEELDGKNY